MTDKTVFKISGNRVFNNAAENMVVKPRLPNGVYTVKFSMDAGYYLEAREEFELPKKMYGDVHLRAERVINTFFERDNNTGVLLTGTKGNGKTLLAKYISTELLKKDVPTIIINSSFCGEDFNTYIASFDRPCVFIIDEFEKTYEDRKAQEKMLTLLDGLASTKHMFIVTVNDIYGVNKYMIARPNRFFYKFDYTQLERSFVREYSEDNLKPEYKKFVEEMVIIRVKNPSINFDALQALIEEVNRYGDSPMKLLNILNVVEAGHDLKLELVGVEGRNEGKVIIVDKAKTYSLSGTTTNVWEFDRDYYLANQEVCDAAYKFTSKRQLTDDVKAWDKMNMTRLYVSAEEDPYSDDGNADIQVKDDGTVIVELGGYKLTFVERMEKSMASNFFLAF